MPKGKTMHELAKEFPNKTYRELEKYRDADRQEEARQIFTQQENEELKEDQHASEMRDAKAQILAAENVQKDLRRDIIKLKKEICELRQDNRKLAHEIEDRINKVRKAGM